MLGYNSLKVSYGFTLQYQTNEKVLADVVTIFLRENLSSSQPLPLAPEGENIDNKVYNLNNDFMADFCQWMQEYADGYMRKFVRDCS